MQTEIKWEQWDEASQKLIIESNGKVPVGLVTRDNATGVYTLEPSTNPVIGIALHSVSKGEPVIVLQEGMIHFGMSPQSVRLINRKKHHSRSI